MGHRRASFQVVMWEKSPDQPPALAVSSISSLRCGEYVDVLYLDSPVHLASSGFDIWLSSSLGYTCSLNVSHPKWNMSVLPMKDWSLGAPSVWTCLWVNQKVQLGVVVHACNPSTWWLQQENWKIQALLGYTGRPSLSKQTNKSQQKQAKSSKIEQKQKRIRWIFEFVVTTAQGLFWPLLYNFITGEPKCVCD